MDDELYEECVTSLKFSTYSALRHFSSNDPSSISEWLDEDKIRALLQPNGPGRVATSKESISNDAAEFTLLAGYGDGKWDNLSITETLFRDVMGRLMFPKHFAQSIRTNNGSLATFDEYGENAGTPVTHISIVIQTPNSPARNFSCVVRTCIRTRATTCFLFDRHPEHLDLLFRNLQARKADASDNPLTILEILFEEHGFSVERYREALDIEVVRMERQTGMSSLVYRELPHLGLSLRSPRQKEDEVPPRLTRRHSYNRRKSTTNTCAQPHSEDLLSTRTRVEPEKHIDYATLTRDLNACKTSLIFLEGLTKFESSFGSFLVDHIKRLDGLCLARLPAKVTGYLKDGLAYHVNLAEFRRSQGQSLQKRVDTQLTVLYSLISQRDSKLSMSVAEDTKKIATAAKRDSSSMKTIAALTLIYLPGTFVAAVLAINGTKSLWVYFAITIPLTIVTVGLWVFYLGWRARESKLVEETDRRAVERFC